MALHVNPFAELYVGETVPPSDFVRLFSPFLVEHASLLFQRGNVVLTGVQGSGKTMLLSLLRPSIRLAFHKAKTPFPVPEAHSHFISAGISLRNSGVMSFGQRAFEKDAAAAHEVTPLYFADYLNYALVLDLLASLQLLTEDENAKVAEQVGLSTSVETQNRFAAEVAADPCWLGALDGVETVDEMKLRLASRIEAYLSFLQFNSSVIPQGLASSKTAAGIPVSITAKALRNSGVAGKDVNVFVRIDQYEELDSIRRLPNSLGVSFREIINRILGMRDPHVFYRVGARRHAWRANLRMYGAEGVLEDQREYEEVDLEEILRRKENLKTFLFMRFAADVTRRRLLHAGYQCDLDGKKLLRALFPRTRPEEKARMCLRGADGALQRRAIGVDENWPPQWQESVLENGRTDPLLARLQSAWIAQQLARGQLPAAPPKVKAAQGWTREYWRKERVPQALMQLAAAAGQRMIWVGYSDIEALAGGNILVYASIAKSIWAAWLRTAEQRPNDADLRVPSFDARVQAAGIEEASLDWFRKVAEKPRGGTRKKFIDIVARRLVTQMLDDRAMSYPGHYGFSLADDEVEREPKVKKWLREASDVGDLVEVVHTTKERDRRSRRKYYMQPALSPFLKIPAVHVKEPLYVHVETVVSWLAEAEGDVRKSADRSEDERRERSQLRLF